MITFSMHIGRFQIEIILSLLLIVFITVSNIQAQQLSDTLPLSVHTKERAIMDFSHHFNILMQVKGNEYQIQKRTLMEDSQSLTSLIAANESSSDWKRRVHANILAGWLQYPARYQTILRELDAVNVEQESKTAVGISRIWDAHALKAQKDYKHSVLPLSWEVILKFEHDWPNWKLITFLHMIAAVPDTRSIEPVLWLLEHTDDNHLRQAAVKTLVALPHKAVKIQIQCLSEKLGEIHKSIDDVLYEME